MNREKQNNFGVNKKVIALIIIAICIIVAIVITIIIANNNEQRNLETSNNKQMQEIENSDNSYNMNVSSEETYNSSSNISQEIVMPNLVGINYADLSHYLANNDLYFISDIKFIFS